VSDPEVTNNLGMVVNNAGKLMANRFFDQDPAELQTMHKLNLYPITLLSKYAGNFFRAQATPTNQFGIIQLSSTASEFTMPQLALYCATKRYNEVLGDCFAK